MVEGYNVNVDKQNRGLEKGYGINVDEDSLASFVVPVTLNQVIVHSFLL